MPVIRCGYCSAPVDEYGNCTADCGYGEDEEDEALSPADVLKCYASMELEEWLSHKGEEMRDKIYSRSAVAISDPLQRKLGEQHVEL